MKKLNNNRGETLIEGIVSLLMLAVLLAGAYAMITSSLNIISTSYEADNAFRTQINKVIEGDYVKGKDSKISFKIDEIIPESEKVEIEYNVYNENGIVAFKPN
ncbi:prepilin-type N-terminal cleavage/methylation domain-containing protein [Proteocatella sphenisci]|uniref:prepilin-type N-terminal cleavage/methylation domain-containing protein n=1 Tax=Proteocatella sphenisci TaxID=181070 RepID=UPI00049142D0|nr:prepilin-type N-terminal cleavage/methylation domain-containing protein [Proteocatella sphenisci]